MAGCSSTPAASPPDRTIGSSAPSAAGPSSTPTLVRPVERRCGTDLPDTLPVVEKDVTATGGARLATVVLGTGRHGVVLLHQTDRIALCGWLPFAAHLAATGFRVDLFDFRCAGESTCPDGDAGTDVIADVRAQDAYLRREGATDTTLVGASRGGAVAIAACAAVPARRCAALSPALFDDDFGRGSTARHAIPALHKPLLVAAAPDDPDSPLADDQSLAATAPPGTVDFVALPAGAGHGWDTLADPGSPGGWSPFAGRLVTFLRAA